MWRAFQTEYAAGMKRCPAIARKWRASAWKRGAFQSIAVLLAGVAGNPNAYFQVTPMASAALPSQFYHTDNPVIYADALQVGPAFSGYSADYMVMNVVISGHLISIP